MDFDLTPFCKTKAEAMDFIARLDRIADKIYQTGFTLEKSLLEEFGMQKRDKFLALLRENNINSTSATQVKGILEKLREYAASLPVLSLTLAFEPPEETLMLLSKWFLLNVKKQFLFDITIDTSFIAGAAVGIDGKFADYSVKQKVQKIIQDALTPKTLPPKPESHLNPDTMHLGR